MEEKEKKRTCPFLNEYCIKERCEVYAEVTRNMGGLLMKSGMCPVTAILMMLSELNQKAQGQKLQKIQLPDLRR